MRLGESRGKSQQTKRRYVFQFLLLSLLSSCGDDNPTVSEDTPTFSVMTWNVYIGGDVQTAFASLDNPLQHPAAASAFWKAVNDSDFPSRAQSIATIIARERPHFIGLREVSRFLTQSPGDFLIGNPVQAQDVAIYFHAHRGQRIPRHPDQSGGRIGRGPAAIFITYHSCRRYQLASPSHNTHDV